ncbi:cell division/cell wall cluster transcriptional repressor MraZ [Gammaproteobacteria bacterium 53_120_T64]|nr:cell division/cell wall cluster transcriptional repressor MraZ [Gammaproteobacteria bacterium 53_120_T64]
MFRGSDEVNMDAKGRMPIPARYRDALMSEFGGSLVATISLTDNCLFIYPRPEWEELEAKIASMPTLNKAARSMQHLLIGNARDLELDGSGRVLVPKLLRDHAGLGKGVTLVGQSHRLELWDTDTWNANRKALLDELANGLEIPEEFQSLSL